MNNTDSKLLEDYYEVRAPEYEAVYGFTDPARRKELEEIEDLAKTSFSGKNVLEIACGTGYWTELLSIHAKSILALDSSEAMLEIARTRKYAQQNVTHKRYDAYSLKELPEALNSEKFDAAIAGFWMSHIPKELMPAFLSGLQTCLKTGAPVLFLDNNLVEGMGGPVVEKPDSSDTFKERKLADGSTHVILKNYFTKQALQTIIKPYANQININIGQWYWSALYLSQ